MNLPFESFPNYTWEMYNGNIPSCKGHKMLDGGIADKWEFKYGNMETYKGEVLFASFSFNKNITIYVCGNSLWIVKNLISGVYQYCVNYSGMPSGVCIPAEKIHNMKLEEAEKILNTKIDNCKAWDMVQSKAKELFYG